jgi:hypothetical protein
MLCGTVVCVAALVVHPTVNNGGNLLLAATSFALTHAMRRVSQMPGGDL